MHRSSKMDEHWNDIKRVKLSPDVSLSKAKTGNKTFRTEYSLQLLLVCFVVGYKLIFLKSDSPIAHNEMQQNVILHQIGLTLCTFDQNLTGIKNGFAFKTRGNKTSRRTPANRIQSQLMEKRSRLKATHVSSKSKKVPFPLTKRREK